MRGGPGIGPRPFARDDGPAIDSRGDDMAICANCGKMIESGGIKLGDQTFCDGTCMDNVRKLWSLAPSAPRGPADFARQIHSGPCPVCRGPGPIDVHDTHWVWSALVLTRWGSRSQVSCRWCGIKSQVLGIAQSAVLGWWGFPWGFIFTPVQIIRNVIGICTPSPKEPSERLLAIARDHLSGGQ